MYAVTCRKRGDARQTKLDIWSRPLTLGQPLPSLPVWLSEIETVTLDLEASYEETCRVLRIARFARTYWASIQGVKIGLRAITFPLTISFAWIAACSSRGMVSCRTRLRDVPAS